MCVERVWKMFHICSRVLASLPWLLFLLASPCLSLGHLGSYGIWNGSSNKLRSCGVGNLLPLFDSM